MKWDKILLGDIAECCLGKMLDQRKNKGEYQPYLGNIDVRWGAFDLDNLSKMRFEADEEERYGLHFGDLVICEGGEPGRCAIWKNQLPNIKIQKALHRVRVKDTMDYRFVYYWFLRAGRTGTIEQYCTGSTIKHLPSQKLVKILVDKPSVEIQHRIADVLSAYDDLIENNQKQIKLLEEAAQRLYKEWFVDLRFPGWENTKIVDGVPEGWKNTTIGEICKVRKEIIEACKIPNGLPYIGLEHMPRKDFCLAAWGISDSVTSNKFMYYDNDIIFGKIRPYFHKVGFALNSGVVSTDAIVLVAKKQLWGLLLSIVSSDAFVDYSYQNCKEGAKMPRADWNQMSHFHILLASEAIQKKFECNISGIVQKIKKLALQNRLLRESRDRLLPKLMSGELEV